MTADIAIRVLLATISLILFFVLVAQLHRLFDHFADLGHPVPQPPTVRQRVGDWWQRTFTPTPADAETPPEAGGSATNSPDAPSGVAEQPSGFEPDPDPKTEEFPPVQPATQPQERVLIEKWAEPDVDFAAWLAEQDAEHRARMDAQMAEWRAGMEEAR